MKQLQEELALLEKYAEILSVAVTTEEAVFIKSPLIYGGAERYSILGYRLIIEVSKEILQYYSFPKSNRSEEIFKILEKNRLYPPWLTTSLTQNINYAISKNNEDLLLEMDKEKLYGLLDDVIRDFRHFKKYVLEYVI